MASCRNLQPVQTRPCLCCIMSTVIVCGRARALMHVRCPCAETHCELNTPTPPLPSHSLSVSLTSQHTARGQTCISLHSPPSLPPSLFLFSPLSSPLPCFSTFFCSSEEGVRKHEGRQNVDNRVCVEAHMAAVALSAIIQLFALALMFPCCEVNRRGHGTSRFKPESNM